MIAILISLATGAISIGLFYLMFWVTQFVDRIWWAAPTVFVCLFGFCAFSMVSLLAVITFFDDL